MPAIEPQRHQQRTSRHARYFTAGGPAEPTSAVTELWFVLHGYGQRADRFLRRFLPHANEQRRFVAPEALSRFYIDDDHSRVGASWMTREDREAEIADAHAWLDQVWQSEQVYRNADTRIVVFGFSQGAPTAARWMLARGIDAPEWIGWGAGLPHDVDLSAVAPLLRDKRLRLVLGHDDPFITAEHRSAEAQRLQAAGIEVEVVEYDGGHELPAETLRRVIEG